MKPLLILFKMLGKTILINNIHLQKEEFKQEIPFVYAFLKTNYFTKELQYLFLIMMNNYGQKIKVEMLDKGALEYSKLSWLDYNFRGRQACFDDKPKDAILYWLNALNVIKASYNIERTLTITVNVAGCYNDQKMYQLSLDLTKTLIQYAYSQKTSKSVEYITNHHIFANYMLGLYQHIIDSYHVILLDKTKLSEQAIRMNILTERKMGLSREIVKELIEVSKVSEYDELGLLQKIDLHRDGASIMSNTYSYKYRSNNVNGSKQISKEVIEYGCNTVTRQYVTDALGNITGVTDPTFGSHTYQYDYRGFLINEDGKEYAYDENGNITKAGTVLFTYDSTIKDRLASINGKSIIYSSSNPGNPRWYDGKDYVFEGRRLKSISSSDSYGGEELSFEYNDQGLRISKTQSYWYNDDRDSEEETTHFFYDGDKLITQINDRLRLDFLYDENGQLYGLIKDNSTKYFYVRDFMQNILGIVDISGNLVENIIMMFMGI